MKLSNSKNRNNRKRDLDTKSINLRRTKRMTQDKLNNNPCNLNNRRKDSTSLIRSIKNRRNRLISKKIKKQIVKLANQTKSKRLMSNLSNFNNQMKISLENLPEWAEKNNL